MRGQVSMELFFAVSLFVLVLFWFNHFVGAASDASDATQKWAARSAALSLADVADSACTFRQVIDVPAPCLSFREPLSLGATGRSLRVGNASVQTACTWQDASLLVFDCATARLCIRNQGGVLNLTEGPCV